MDTLGKLRIVCGILIYLTLLVTVTAVFYLFHQVTVSPFEQGHKADYSPLPGLRSATGKTIPIDSRLCGCKNCSLSNKTCWSGVGFQCRCE